MVEINGMRQRLARLKVEVVQTSVLFFGCEAHHRETAAQSIFANDMSLMVPFNCMYC
jgi:hypothetical protein